MGVGIGAVGDRQHRRLDRRQPQGECPREVLDQDADEALETAEDGTVDHHRHVRGVVGADVGELEPGRHLIVELDGAALPLPAQRVGDVEIDLRAVEGALPGFEHVGLLGGIEGLAERRLGGVPRRDLAQELLGPRGQLGRVLQAEVAVDRAAPASAAPRLRRAICSSVTKQCASSCENWRTRVRPASTPEASLRCSGVCSCRRSGRSL